MSEPRCYTVADILRLLQLTLTTYKRLKAAGQLPMLEELRPRIGRRPRYRADLVDRYLEGRWDAPRSFAAARRRVG